MRTGGRVALAVLFWRLWWRSCVAGAGQRHQLEPVSTRTSRPEVSLFGGIYYAYSTQVSYDNVPVATPPMGSIG